MILREQGTRFIMLVAAVMCIGAALALVVRAGLPERAAYTGQIVNGQVVAPEPGAIAPPFDAQTPDGTTLRLADYAGKPVVLNFWATWCESCRVEMPELQRLYEAEYDRGLRVIGINTGEAPEDVLDWRENYGLTFDMALDPRGDISDLYFLRGQPTTYVVAPDGRVTQVFYGPISQAALRAALDPYLEVQPQVLS